MFRLLPRSERRRYERRRYPRGSARPLRLSLEGRTYKTSDWSLGGIGLSRYHRALAIDERIEGTILPFAGMRRGECILQVVRMSDAGEVGLKFVEVDAWVFMSISEMAS